MNMRRSKALAGPAAGAADLRPGARTVPRPDRGVGASDPGLGDRGSRGGTRAGRNPRRGAAGRAVPGALHGIPIGVKDIIDVVGMPTGGRISPWKDKVATHDAGIVASLRAAGAVILGKTVTTQFAWIDPRSRGTPGTSNGRRAARRADRRRPWPAACAQRHWDPGPGLRSSARPPSAGLPSLKPTFNGSMDGIVPFAPHLDHPGPIARERARPWADLHGILPSGRGRDTAVGQPRRSRDLARADLADTFEAATPGPAPL